MSFNSIERKIQKYTHKLSRSTTRDRANLYQQKLRYYHDLKQSGGADEQEILGGLEDLKNLKEKIMEKFKKNKENMEVLRENIRECKERDVGTIDIEGKLKELNEENEKLKLKLEELEKGETLTDEELDTKGQKIDDLEAQLEKQIGDSDKTLENILGLVNLAKGELEILVEQEGGCGGACGLPLLPMYSEY